MKLLGASVLLFCLWVASVSLFLGISWISVMDRIGRWSLLAFEKARIKIDEFRDRAEGRRSAAARQDIVNVEKKLKANREKPRIEPVMSVLEPSERAEKERQVPLFEPPAAGELPPLSLLDDPPEQKAGYSTESLEAMSRLVELKLKDFGIDVEVKSVSPGPFRARSRSRGQGQSNRKSCERPGAVPVCGQCTHRRSDTWQVVCRSRDSQ